MRRARKGGFASGVERQDIGRSRGGLTTKIHLKTNGLGLPVGPVLSAGETSNSKGYGPVMDEPGPVPKVMIGDKGYDCGAIRDDLASRGVTPVIPHKRNRKVQEPIDGFVYALRNRIERCFNKLDASKTSRSIPDFDSMRCVIVDRRARCGVILAFRHG
jgi:transposase